ncbi:Slp family lipoprotein [Dokdonella sp.]|uniref:Slp family lipoprotein n=1 Tax=Dokdonella sp. TaxID=2291710 RepID=UPI003526D1D4
MRSRRVARSVLALAALLALMTGCATPVFQHLENTIAITPVDVQQAAERFKGAEVLWGGRIVSIEHLESSTRVEIVAYPLNRAQQPAPEAGSVGRFVLLVPGIAEPPNYAPGRHLTAQGVISGLWQARTNDRKYLFPVVQATAVNIWPWGFMLDSQPQISIGIGVGTQIH